MTNGASYDEIPQVPGGYYYAPYQDNGPYERLITQAGEAVAGVLAEFSDRRGISNAASAGGAEASGLLIGKTIGYYLDNASVIVQNVNTLMDELNDPNTWNDPFSEALVSFP
jgi:hypothetical protein